MADEKQDIVTHAKKRWEYYDRRYATFLNRAKKDFEFYRSKQWSDVDREKMESKGRPCLTKNRIKPKVNLVNGEYAQNRFYFKVIAQDSAPAEYNGIAKMITERLKQVENENDGEYELQDCFKDGTICGRGYLEPFVKEFNDVLPSRRLVLFEHREYNRVFVDPDSRKYDLSDARDIFILTNVSKDDLLEMFPDKTAEIEALGEGSAPGENDGVQHKDYQTRAASETEGSVEVETNLIMKEYHYYKIEKQSVLVSNASENPVIVPNENLEAVKALHDTIKMSRPDYDYRIIKQNKKKWYICLYVGDLLLSEQENPIDELLICQYVPDRVKSENDLAIKDFGIVTDLIDLNEEYNKYSSVSMAHLLSSVHSGIVAEEGVLIDEHKWKDYGSAPGFIGKVKAGGMGRWQRLEPANITNHSVFASNSAMEIDEVSNIRPDLMGTNAKDQSGKALALMQNQGYKGIYFYLDNMRRTQHILCRKLVKLICYLEDIDYNLLKIVVDDMAMTPTARYANWMETKELIESGLLQSPYADLIIDGMDIANRDEWKKRWTETNEFAQFQAQQEAAKKQAAMHDNPQAIQAAEEAAKRDAMAELGMGGV